MIEALYNKIDKFCNETDWSKYLTYEHALEEFIKEIVEEETKELKEENKVLAQNLEDTEILNKTYEKRFSDLEKENAELKADFLKACKVKEQGFREAEQALEHKDDQLTKAKEIIKQLLLLPYANNEEVFADVTSILDKAEQFLSEVEK